MSGTISDAGLLCGQRAFFPSPMSGSSVVNLADGGHVPNSVNTPTLLQFTDSCYVGVDVALNPAGNVDVAERVRATDGNTVAVLISMKLGSTATLTVSRNGRAIDIQHLQG